MLVEYSTPKLQVSLTNCSAHRLAALKGPLGCGKTEGVARWIVDHSEASVVAVTPRISMAKALSARLSPKNAAGAYMSTPVQCYDDADTRGRNHMIKAHRVVVCLPSIKYIQHPPDLLVIDEIIGVLTLLGAREILENRGDLVWRNFLSLLRSAKRVVIADGDLGKGTVAGIRELIGGVGDNDVEVVEHLTDVKARGVLIYSTLGAIVQRISTTSHAYVTTDSLATARVLAEYFKSRDPLVISSEQPLEEGRLRSLLAGQHTLVIATPTITSSVSIDGPAVDAKYTVFALFCAGNQAATDAHQMIARVRHPADPIIHTLLPRDALSVGESDLKKLLKFSRELIPQGDPDFELMREVIAAVDARAARDAKEFSDQFMTLRMQRGMPMQQSPEAAGEKTRDELRFVRMLVNEERIEETLGAPELVEWFGEEAANQRDVVMRWLYIFPERNKDAPPMPPLEKAMYGRHGLLMQCEFRARLALEQQAVNQLDANALRNGGAIARRWGPIIAPARDLAAVVVNDLNKQVRVRIVDDRVLYGKADITAEWRAWRQIAPAACSMMRLPLLPAGRNAEPEDELKQALDAFQHLAGGTDSLDIHSHRATLLEWETHQG